MQKIAEYEKSRHQWTLFIILFYEVNEIKPKNLFY